MPKKVVSAFPSGSDITMVMEDGEVIEYSRAKRRHFQVVGPLPNEDPTTEEENE